MAGCGTCSAWTRSRSIAGLTRPPPRYRRSRRDPATGSSGCCCPRCGACGCRASSWSRTRLRPYPAVLCLHGHGMSKDILAGAPRNEAERERMELLRGDFAAKFARAGYLTIAPDAAGFGERVEEVSLAQTKNNCQHLSVNALSLGMSLQGIRVWEILPRPRLPGRKAGRAAGPHRRRGPVHGMRARDVRRRTGRTSPRVRPELRAAGHHPRREAHLLVRLPLLAWHLQRDGLAGHHRPDSAEPNTAAVR